MPPDKVEVLLARVSYYNFDLASVIRFTSEYYTTSHLGVEAILKTLKTVGLQDVIYQYIKRALTIGYPAYFFNKGSTDEIFKTFFIVNSS